MSNKTEIEDLFGDPKPTTPKREQPARRPSRQPVTQPVRSRGRKSGKYPSQIKQSASRRQNRIAVDSPPGLRDEVKGLAKHFDCSVSDLAAYLIIAGLDLYHDGQLDIEAVLIPTKSTRSTYGIDFDQVLNDG